jgi:hypothetical protein
LFTSIGIIQLEVAVPTLLHQAYKQRGIFWNNGCHIAEYLSALKNKVIQN